jgi:HAD superfamily phosphoserine phosphatase-like hydrolase
MLQKKDIVVFDFDGTLSASDSNTEFLKYCFKHSVRPWMFLPYVMAGLVGAKIKRGGIWWRQIMRRFITPKMVNDFANSFIKQHKQNRFVWAKNQVEKEKKAGNKVVLISAGPDYLIPKLVSDINFDAVICSKMSDKEPWKYEFLCWGKNKVIALDKWAIENKIIPNVIRAYSDSKSDLPIMSIAKEQIWINRKTGLRKQ